MNIKDLVNPTPKSAWVSYDDKISFQVSYLSRPRLKLLSEQCTVLQYDPRAKVHQPKLDNKKLTNLFISETVIGWKGVTIRSLSSILPLDMSKVEAGQLDAEIPFDMETLEQIIEHSKEVDSFLFEAATDVRCFNASSGIPAEDAAKNS